MNTAAVVVKKRRAESDRMTGNRASQTNTSCSLYLHSKKKKKKYRANMIFLVINFYLEKSASPVADIPMYYSVC